MLSYFRTCVLLLFVLCLLSCNDKEVEQIPTTEFFKTTEKSFFRISPDGKYVSYFKTYQDKQNIFIQSLVDGKERRATSFTDFPVSEYFWAGGNQIIFTKDLVTLNKVQIFSVDAVSLKNHNLLSMDKVRSRLLSRNYKNPDWITIGLNKRDSTVYDVYQLNIKTGMLMLEIPNPGNLTQWYTDTQGHIKLAKASDGLNETLYYRSSKEAGFKPLFTNNFKNVVKPVGFTADTNIFYALSNVNRDKIALVKIDVRSKKERVILANQKADITGVSYSNHKRYIESVQWEDAKPHKYFLDATMRKVNKDLSRLLPAHVIDIIDRDSAEQKFLISTYTDRDPGSTYIYQIKDKRLYKLGDVNIAIDPAEMCEMQPINFMASDGLPLSGYLTIPKVKIVKNLPLVVIPHEGLWLRDSWGYNAEVQFLANRGYAVLQVNYRGTKGYGKDFHKSGFKEIGGKIQEDINDGVRWLIEKKIADPKRIGIYGTGLGGFSALFGACFHPELYGCASMQSGVINFFSYIKDAPVYYKPYLSMLYEMVGNPKNDAERFRDISPVFHADQITVPLLIFQGARDPRANIMELNQFIKELRKSDVSVKYILKENENAIFSNERNRLELYTELEAFLEENLKNRM